MTKGMAKQKRKKKSQECCHCRLSVCHARHESPEMRCRMLLLQLDTLIITLFVRISSAVYVALCQGNSHSWRLLIAKPLFSFFLAFLFTLIFRHNNDKTLWVFRHCAYQRIRYALFMSCNNVRHRPNNLTHHYDGIRVWLKLGGRGMWSTVQKFALQTTQAHTN